MANRPTNQLDLSNYLLWSLAAAVVLLAMAGPTSTPIWIFLGLWWVGLAIADYRVNRLGR
jgi:hypothetical protein